MTQDTKNDFKYPHTCKCGKKITEHDYAYDGKCVSCRTNENKKPTKEYMIRLDKYDIAILKQRPKKAIFTKEISDAVVDDIIKQILKQRV